MANVVIFGLLDTAELAHYYLTEDSPHTVAGFTVHAAYRQQDTFKGLPVVDFERLTDVFPPDQYHLFAPMTARGMNRLREQIYLAGKQAGYRFINYIHHSTTIPNNVTLGDNCFILEHNTIQPFTHIGNNVVIWSGNHLGHHSKVDDHVFFTRVIVPGHCHIHPYCFLGSNATLRDYTTLAEGTLVGMGANLVQQQTEPWCIYTGNPAKKVEGKRSEEIM